MNLGCFVAAFAIFTSVSVAHGANSMVAPKMVQGMTSAISSENSLLNERVNSALSKVFQREFFVLITANARQLLIW